MFLSTVAVVHWTNESFVWSLASPCDRNGKMCTLEPMKISRMAKYIQYSEDAYILTDLSDHNHRDMELLVKLYGI